MEYTIYKYIKKDINEVVYVGRTNNFSRRKNEHEKYEPFEEGRPHYNYPLSRGIRKYGVDAYQCEIIEIVTTYEESLSREKYWIKYYDTFNDPSKYNYTPGGELSFTTAKFNDEIIDEVKSLLEQQIDFKTIQDRTGVSLSHISEINTGKRRKDANRSYPINTMTYGRKLTNKDLNEIINLLANTTLTYQEISMLYGVVEAVIGKINRGISYKNSSYNYPIRKEINKSKKHHRLNNDEIQQLINKIINTTTSFSDLAKEFNISTTTVYNLNNGVTHKNENLTYPLRK